MNNGFYYTVTYLNEITGLCKAPHLNLNFCVAEPETRER
jgi:hypothetical protein